LKDCNSVADNWTFIPDPESCFFSYWIPNPKQEKRGKKKKRLSYLFCSHKFHNIENYFSFEQIKKKTETIDKELKYFNPKKQLLRSQNMGVRIQDPGSEIRKKPFPDPGIKKAPDPGSGILQRHKKKTIFNQTLKKEWDPELYNNGYGTLLYYFMKFMNTFLRRI
jgi:hypothetical protein